ncbi:MAG: NAD-binding protein [Candidatus Eisenbacteria bacterium]|uniref:NAD-binding protein n=1 Tax=Eiseniibacteriota bacterium TaxID=2212470 RepID=A0A956SF16_UNCEI|nr:NAD-binding protein [Candidatus Eisenbacteria bacterium]
MSLPVGGHATRLEKRGIKRIVSILIGTWAVVGVGTIGYMILESWSFGEAFYMTVITLTTVGFGEVHPLHPLGRVFTALLIFLGVGLLAYSASVLGAFFLDGTFAYYLRRRRLQKVIGKLDGHCIVCGYGRTGRRVVAILQERGIPFVIVEVNEEKVNELLEDGIAAIHGTGHQNEVLETAQIDRAKALIACATDDAENVFITLSARALRRDLIIVARAEDDDSEGKLKRAGANQAINPFVFSSERLVSAAYRPNLVEFLDTHVRGLGDYDIHEFKVQGGSNIAGHPLSDLSLRPKYKTTILAIRKADGSFVPNPEPGAKLEPDDVFVGFGPKDKLLDLQKECLE